MNNYDKLLSDYNDFSECIIRDIYFYNYQTVVEIKMDYVWNTINQNGFKSFPTATLRFDIVQEINIKNSLNSSMILDMDQLNWGINEISGIKIMNDVNFLNVYNHLPIKFQHAVILWEDNRRIDIVFAYMKVELTS